MLVHLGREHLPPDLIAYEVELPDEAVEVLAEVPSEWFADPLFRQTRRYGDAWLVEGRSLALRVPTAVIPDEYNILVNPLHAEIARMQKIASFPFTFDPRLGG